ncbi:large subunit ribosomal protein L21 [Motilibacter peucedani]|uniref:Large ribosomal subunit protein bL21 n=1 Tax=Motilibacter peucedani TaxID=598650 RepID=A0A420XNU0_9ACTN|nr:large subunit ribosomal protein L21 [Motilibacter peucedani]
MYAIVRAGGRQEKVAVGDLVVLDRVAGEPGSSLQLQPLLLVDGETITSDAAALSGVTVTAEVVDHRKGVKIDILRYKNKTGYRRRQGYRSSLTAVKVTGIETAASVETAN